VNTLNTGSTGEIEVVTPAQWERLRRIRLEALAESPENFGSTLAREEAFDEDEWRTRAQRPSTVIASVDGQDVGLAGVYQFDEVWQVTSMWVRPEHRGRGVVDGLLAAGEALVRRAGDRRMHLWVFEDNARGLGAYRRAGFAPTGGRQHGRDGRDEIELDRSW